MSDPKLYDIAIVDSNDLTHDRRMHRTCVALADAGWKVLLIGRELKTSKPLQQLPYDQERVVCRFNKGPLFYAELIYRLSRQLKSCNYKRLLCVDEDTLGVLSLLDKGDREYYFDAHEFFTEVPELLNAPIKRMIWNIIGRRNVQSVDHAYTVSLEIAGELKAKYNKHFDVIQNVPELLPISETIPPKNQDGLTLVYLGVLNPGRGLEESITVVKSITSCRLIVIGDGPLRKELEAKSRDCGRIVFKGMMAGEELHRTVALGDVGINLLDVTSKSYYLSLANKFFDYANAGLPSICMNTPTYKRIGEKYNTTYFIDELDVTQLSQCLTAIIDNKEGLQKKRQGALKLREDYNWDVESRRLLSIYKF